MSAQQELEALKKSHSEMAEQIKALEAKINEENSSKLITGIAPAGQEYFILCQDTDGKFKTHRKVASHGAILKTTPVIRSEAVAKDFAEAINVMLELRTQPGVQLFDGKLELWIPYYSVDHNTLRYGNYRAFWHGFAPGFQHRHEAEAAVKAVGEERVIKAFSTLMKLK